MFFCTVGMYKYFYHKGVKYKKDLSILDGKTVVGMLINAKGYRSERFFNCNEMVKPVVRV